MNKHGGAAPQTAAPLTTPGPPVEPEKGLRRTLDNRHIVMIALGGIIGAGLFVGSGAVINKTGPAAVLSYAVSGVLMILVIRAIGEMAVARPSSGSVANFSREGLGNWAGFSVGWLYWYFWVIVAAIEAVAGAGILVNYVPGVPAWLLCLGLVLVMTGINLLSVKAYGEAEFWFASIKVIAIIFFICVTGLYLLGGVGPESPGLTNLFAHGGLFPYGIVAALVGSVTVLFSMGGAEIATIAAAESKKPVEFAAKATKQVMARVFAFYVLSILLIVAAIPWDTPFGHVGASRDRRKRMTMAARSPPATCACGWRTTAPSTSTSAAAGSPASSTSRTAATAATRTTSTRSPAIPGACSRR